MQHRILITLAATAAFYTAGALAPLPPADATTIAGPTAYQRYADSSRIATPPGVVVVSADTTVCGGALACSTPGTIYIGQAGRSAFLYELGHQFDFAADGGWGADSMPLRDTFRRITGTVGRDWWGFDDPDASQPDEDFASDYTFCAMGWPVSHTGRRVCALVKRVGRRMQP